MSDDDRTRCRSKPTPRQGAASPSCGPPRMAARAGVPLQSLHTLRDLGLSDAEIAAYFRRFRGTAEN